MAKKRASVNATPMSSMPMEPSPKQELVWAMERAVEKAVLAHPRTQKLRDAIHQRMMKAAGNGDGADDSASPSRGKRSKKSKA